MTQTAAARSLEHLAHSAEALRTSFGYGRHLNDLTQMKYEAAGIVASFLGPNHSLATRLSEIDTSQKTVVFSSLQGHDVADEFIGLVRAAISLVSVADLPAARNPPTCDPDLWKHIEELVTIEAWAKIPADVATFVEDWFRKRAGDPRDEKGKRLVGRSLYLRVLSDHPLGGEPSERDGWKSLGTGLAQAVGNLHRHNIEKRPDAEQLAWSVIGLGSLLIGEMKLTYPEPPRDV